MEERGRTVLRPKETKADGKVTMTLPKGTVVAWVSVTAAPSRSSSKRPNFKPYREKITVKK